MKSRTPFDKYLQLFLFPETGNLDSRNDNSPDPVLGEKLIRMNWKLDAQVAVEMIRAFDV